MKLHEDDCITKKLRKDSNFVFLSLEALGFLTNT